MSDKVTHISQLNFDQRNPRKHNPRNIGVVVDSLQKVGAARSIVIDENNQILAGNGVTEAATLAGIEKVVEVEADGNTLIAVRRRDLTDEQKQALKYYDNRSGELAEWSADVILADFEAGAVDFSQLWNETEWSALLEGFGSELLGRNGAGGEPAEPQELIDKAEELQKIWQVQPGDVWQIDKHRLICGDCRNPDDLDKLLQGQKVNGVFTSPPYAEQRKKQYGGIPTAEYVDWWEAVQDNVKRVLAQDGSFFVNIKPHCEQGQRVLYVFDLVLAMVRRWGWRFVDELCWIRNTPPGKYSNRFKNGFEPVYHFSMGGAIKFNPWKVAMESDEAILEGVGGGFNAAYDPMNQTHKGAKLGQGLALPSNALHINQGEVNIGTLSQPATFPLALPDFFIKAYSDPGDSWLDPFAGSGTTAIAAHRNNRTGFLVEKLPKYCAVICERFKAEGRQPERVSG